MSASISFCAVQFSQINIQALDTVFSEFESQQNQPLSYTVHAPRVINVGGKKVIKGFYVLLWKLILDNKFVMWHAGCDVSPSMQGDVI